jgi:hypothetical protein
MKPVIRLAVVVAIVAILSPVASRGSQTLTFQDGDGGAYSSTQGAMILPGLSTGSDGSGPTIGVEGLLGQELAVGLLRFPDIIGNNPGQIPPGSTIESATLQVTRVNSSDFLVSVWKMVAAWDENTVTGTDWSWMFGVFFSTFVGTVPAGTPGNHVVDITSLVQEWSSGVANRGVMFSPPLTESLLLQLFYSDDAPDQSTRPLLSVTFTPAPTPVESATWGKVKALYR